MDDFHALESCKEWIARFVIRHNICPFAQRVFVANDIAYYTETASDYESLAVSFLDRISTLRDVTAFLIYRTQFPQFLDFLDFYYACEAILEDSLFNDEFQIVAFHPEYIFEGEDVNDPSNMTNRSPFPMIHILRRSHVEKAIEAYGNVEDITARNIAYLRKLHK